MTESGGGGPYQSPRSDLVGASAAPAAPEMGVLQKLVGVIFSPGKTFAAIAAKPGWDWVVPLILLALCVSVYQTVTTSRFDKEGAIAETMAKIEANPRIPADQKAGIEQRVRGQFEMGEKPLWRIVGVVAMMIPVFLVGLIYWGAARAFGKRPGYMQLVAGYSWCLVATAIYWLLTAVVVLPRDKLGLFETQNMLLLKSNPAAFMGQGSGAGLVTLLSFVDVFVIWGLVLRSTMLEKVAGFSKGASWAVAGTLLGLWVLIRAGLAALGQMFGG